MIAIQITQIANGWVVAANHFNKVTNQQESKAIFCEDLAAVITVLKEVWPQDQMLKFVKR